jgi:Protein of unknown function (DUF4235)
VKLLFAPIGIIGGLAAGFVGKKLFEQAWSIVDDEDPPQPDQREATVGKLVLAAALEGAVFRAVRALFDHGTRSAFASVTGSWPGEQGEGENGS